MKVSKTNKAEIIFGVSNGSKELAAKKGVKSATQAKFE